MAFGGGIRDAIQEKSKQISDTLSEKYRERIGKELADREQKLQAEEADYAERAQQLDRRESDLVQREKESHRNFLIPKVYVFAPLLLALALGVLLSLCIRSSLQLRRLA